jgi:Na+-driven multidrug efflux pump
MATPVGNYIFTSVMSQFGDEAMAGWAVVGRLTVVAFGGIFSLAGAIGGIFGQNFGARDYDRVRRTYRDAILFGLIYTLVTWAVLIAASGPVARAFALPDVAADVLFAFTHIGAAGFVFASALFVSNSAFNALGKPRRSSVSNWTRDGLLSLPLALWFAAQFGAPGVIYAQAAAGALVGLAAAAWGWQYVNQLHRRGLPRVDLPPPRSYAHADRFRRR